MGTIVSNSWWQVPETAIQGLWAGRLVQNVCPLLYRSCLLLICRMPSALQRLAALAPDAVPAANHEMNMSAMLRRQSVKASGGVHTVSCVVLYTMAGAISTQDWESIVCCPLYLKQTRNRRATVHLGEQSYGKPVCCNIVRQSYTLYTACTAYAADTPSRLRTNEQTRHPYKPTSGAAVA